MNASVIIGRGNIATSQVAIGTSAAQIIAARTNRTKVTVTNLGTVPFYIGNAGVTSANGQLIPGTLGASMTLDYTGALYAIAGSAATASLVETF